VGILIISAETCLPISVGLLSLTNVGVRCFAIGESNSRRTAGIILCRSLHNTAQLAGAHSSRRCPLCLHHPDGDNSDNSRTRMLPRRRIFESLSNGTTTTLPYPDHHHHHRVLLLLWFQWILPKNRLFLVIALFRRHVDRKLITISLPVIACH
jgi:hypothetical protein